MDRNFNTIGQQVKQEFSQFKAKSGNDKTEKGLLSMIHMTTIHMPCTTGVHNLETVTANNTTTDVVLSL